MFRLPALLVSDLHWTANPSDEYRWGLVDWVVTQCTTHGVRTLCVLGDVTDAKDNHPAPLVNRVVHAMLKLRACVDHLYILEGNHDYLLSHNPTFGFLSAVGTGISWVGSPTDISSLDPGEPSAYMLPHSHHPAQAWQGLDLSHYDLVFMHQTIRGARASNGQQMDGEHLPDLGRWGKIWSGDIHVPQKIGHLEYVGSPYHVHFGDNFKPRAVLLRRDAGPLDLHYPSPRRVALTVGSLSALSRADLSPGDHVKLALALPPAEHHAWAATREKALDILKRAGVHCHGIKLQSTAVRKRLISQAAQGGKVRSDADMVASFVQAEDWGADALDIGLELL